MPDANVVVTPLASVSCAVNAGALLPLESVDNIPEIGSDIGMLSPNPLPASFSTVILYVNVPGVHVDCTYVPVEFPLLSNLLLVIFSIPCNGVSVHANPLVHDVPGIELSTVATFISDFVITLYMTLNTVLNHQ